MCRVVSYERVRASVCVAVASCSGSGSGSRSRYLFLWRLWRLRTEQAVHNVPCVYVFCKFGRSHIKYAIDQTRKARALACDNIARILRRNACVRVCCMRTIARVGGRTRRRTRHMRHMFSISEFITLRWVFVLVAASVHPFGLSSWRACVRAYTRTRGRSRAEFKTRGIIIDATWRHAHPCAHSGARIVLLRLIWLLCRHSFYLSRSLSLIPCMHMRCQFAPPPGRKDPRRQRCPNNSRESRACCSQHVRINLNKFPDIPN